MVTTHDDDDANKRCGEEGEKRCFDLFATLLLAFGDDDIRARRGQEEQERNMLMIRTITTAAANTFLFGKRKIDDDHQENTSSSSSSSWSLVESKRRRVEVSDDAPIRAQPIRQIKPPVKKRKEPVRREPGVTPGWLVELMRRHNGVEAKMVIEKVITKTDLKAEQGRFLIPFKQIIEEDFLNERELKIVEEHHSGDGEKGVDVILLSSNDAWNANLRIWEMSNNFNYALCSGWNLFVRQNDLAVNQTRRLWSFHSHDGTLYLAFDPPAMSLALVPFNHAASSSSMALVVSSEDPFVCEEANRRLLPKIPRRSRTPRVWIPDPTSDSTNLNLEGFDLNRTPPPEMEPLEAVQETHIIRTSTSLDLELRL